MFFNLYKQDNVLVGNLHRVKRIGSVLDQEVNNIKTKYSTEKQTSLNSMSTVLYNSFMKNNKKQRKDSFLIPPGLFKEEEDEGFEK